jgi:hypothetical protein
MISGKCVCPDLRSAIGQVKMGGNSRAGSVSVTHIQVTGRILCFQILKKLTLTSRPIKTLEPAMVYRNSFAPAESLHATLSVPLKPRAHTTML